MRYLAIDTETGGIGPQADLLTAYFGIFDENFEFIDEMDVALRPESEDDFFSVSAKALEINKINLVEHFKRAQTKSQIAPELYQFLMRHSKLGSDRLVVVGHNATFDVQKVTDKLISKKTWDQFVSYRKLDTGTLGLAWQSLGLIPSEISASLSSLMKNYGLEYRGEAHTAKADALACIDLLKVMFKQVKDLQSPK